MERLYSLCWLHDGVHWLILEQDGNIVACSPYAFLCEDDARSDVLWRLC